MLKQCLSIKVKYAIFTVLSLVLLYCCGVYEQVFEKDFYKDFHYLYNEDIQEAIQQLRHGEVPNIKPINSYDNIFIRNQSHKCKNPNQAIYLVYLIRSDPEHFNQRLAIRKTWGSEKRFSGVEIRLVFLLGYRENLSLELLINEEAFKYSDIVQANFVDSYENNTIKTMMLFKWASTFCNSGKYYMFVDDDYFVSTKNVLRYLWNPIKYPKYLQGNNISNIEIENRLLTESELPDDVRLYTGYVLNSKPSRYIFSKSYISLEEYPYNKWPAYVTAGAFILSREALLDMYYASFFTKHIHFDNVYIGLLALKTKIKPIHSYQFYIYYEYYYKKTNNFTIASPGYDDPIDLITLWNNQKDLGNA